MRITRSIPNLSMFNPLSSGDFVSIQGREWELSRGGYGWKLHEPGNTLRVHVSIHDIDGMADLIAAIKEADQP